MRNRVFRRVNNDDSALERGGPSVGPNVATTVKAGGVPLWSKRVYHNQDCINKTNRIGWGQQKIEVGPRLGPQDHRHRNVLIPWPVPDGVKDSRGGGGK